MLKHYYVKPIILVLIFTATIYSENNVNLNYQLATHYEAVKRGGSTLLAFGVLGTIWGTGMIIEGNIVMNQNGPGYYNSYGEASTAKENWNKGNKHVSVGGYFLWAGIPMIIGGAIIRNVCNRKIIECTIGVNSLTLNYNF